MKKTDKVNIVNSLILSSSIALCQTLLNPSEVKSQLPPPPPLPLPPPTDIPIPNSINPNSIPPALPSPNRSQTSEAYILGSGDRVQIDIFNVPEYSGDKGQYQILADGTINLPLVGYVSVSGLTLDQATTAISQQYNKYLKRPSITLKLLASRPLQVAIAGEVYKPGSYTVPLTTGLINPGSLVATQQPTVTRAIQLAGGITPTADIRNVKIRRTQRNSPEQILNVDLWSLLQTGDLQADITLRDGDSIFIPTVTELNRLEARQIGDSNFAATNTQPINIAVVGEVLRPGTYTLSNDPKNLTLGVNNNVNGMVMPQTINEPNLPNGIMGLATVTTAVKMAGGITPLADIRKVIVRRVTRAGTEQTINIDLWQLLQTGDVTQDIALQSGDTIVVSKAETTQDNDQTAIATSNLSPSSISISIVGEVLRPGPLVLPPNTPLNQALVATGGFNKARAEMDSVDLVRVNPNGTVTRRKVRIDFGASPNEDTNPILRNNDVIMVRRTGNAAFSDRVGNTIGPIAPFLGLFRVINLLW